MGKLISTTSLVKSFPKFLYPRLIFYILTMIFSVVLLLTATLACLAEAGCPSSDRACAAYFRFINLDPSMFPAGKMWQDKVCCFGDPSKFFECKYFNGVFSSETRQCPDGQLFNWGAKQPWERICVPAHQEGVPQLDALRQAHSP